HGLLERGVTWLEHQGWVPASLPAAAWRAAPTVLISLSVALLALGNLGAVLPTLAYRLSYPPQREFHAGLARVGPSGSVLYGADNCGLAEHFSGLHCNAHQPDPTSEQYEQLAAQLRSDLRSSAVLLLPDFFTYDGRGVLQRRLRADFAVEPVYT